MAYLLNRGPDVANVNVPGGYVAVIRPIEDFCETCESFPDDPFGECPRHYGAEHTNASAKARRNVEREQDRDGVVEDEDEAPLCNHCARPLVEDDPLLDGWTHWSDEDDYECGGPIPPVPMT